MLNFILQTDLYRTRITIIAKLNLLNNSKLLAKQNILFNFDLKQLNNN